MALSTVVSGIRPRHRTARVAAESYQGMLALDWANGQAISLAAGNAQSSVFDTSNDRIVMCSVGGASTVGGCWITVAVNPTATAGAGSMWIPQSEPVPIYVPAGMKVGAIQGQTGGTLALIPALLASDP
jgi:hypothetical protein